jgi:hypothetical protein
MCTIDYGLSFDIVVLDEYVKFVIMHSINHKLIIILKYEN